jgi:hypothetical protein
MPKDNITISKKGRPATDTEPVLVRLPRSMVEAIDAFRRAEPDLPTRPEAVRRILTKGLES